MPIPLSQATHERLARCFPGSNQDEARALLEVDCAENIGWGDDTPTGLERVRFAALKASRGTIPGLVDAIVLAQTDWRDLLVNADFANDARAHERWWPPVA